VSDHAASGTATSGTEIDAAAPQAARIPPVGVLATLSLACVVLGGILMASFAPRRPPLVAPTILMAAGLALLAAAFVLLARIPTFAWRTFWMVYRWALLAYVISAGMIAFAFVRDHVRGAPLGVVLGSLVVFACSVPLAIAFTVGRYADIPE
jgi:uncharacterized membrane protein SirB2